MKAMKTDVKDAKDYVGLVKYLQEAWGTLPDNPRLNLSDMEGTHNQIVEELDEWKEACEHLSKYGRTSEVEHMFRDVTVDLVFYIMQAVVRGGMADNFTEDFNNIFQNNLNKVTDEENAFNTAKHYQSEEGEYHSIRQTPHGYVVIRDKDSKIRKPLGFIEVKLG